MKRLADICDIQYGYAFDSKCFTEDSSYPQLVRIRDVKRGYSETYYSGNYPEEYILSEGDLLIGMDGEFNIASPMWQIMISFRCFWMQKKLKDVLEERYSIIKLQYYICFRK